jgi:hypothetical protein
MVLMITDAGMARMPARIYDDAWYEGALHRERLLARRRERRRALRG